jgi:hypothetical protein
MISPPVGVYILSFVVYHILPDLPDNQEQVLVLYGRAAQQYIVLHYIAIYCYQYNILYD